MASVEMQSFGKASALVEQRPHEVFDIRLDEEMGLVRTSSYGRWTLDDTEDYLAELAELVDQCRRRFGRARVLADLRGSTIQSDAVADRLGDARAALFLESDRLALVVDSSLTKGQMRRRFTHAGSQAFLSHTAAELWVTAWP